MINKSSCMYSGYYFNSDRFVKNDRMDYKRNWNWGWVEKV